MHDTTPVVKVIDFGVAKALGQELTDKTLFTGFAQFLGTPLYMSPEQAGQSALDIDTRSDIYSLGVLLYELLDRHDAVRQGAVQEGGPRRDLPNHPRRGAAQAQHAAERVEGFAAVDLGPAAHGAGQADQAGARRAGLDRDEGAGEGPQPPLRDGQRLRGGRAALPARRAGAGVPAVNGLSPEEVRAAEQRQARPRVGGCRRTNDDADRAGGQQRASDAAAEPDVGGSEGPRAQRCRTARRR